MKYLGGQTRCIMGDVKIPNIKRLASTAARKTLRLRKLDFHIVKNIRIKIYTKEKKAGEENFEEVIHYHIQARAKKSSQFTGDHQVRSVTLECIMC